MTDEGELNNLDRLRWQCRRGMLELDVLLEAFLEQHYSEMPPRMQRQFIQLLEFPDPIIHAWCVGGEKPDDEEFAELVASIRATSVA
ncbi:MAG: succinate dehydrogenase assembly factor 2 [Candidatus Thiodiazotropha taylori]|uniref:FAD assembly factor SdhE n=1 Tax=Candidatus Thiodiazotropha taylori TaxID=2792791 RepID=A0A9E4KBR4_9GAMM|nr:succinate dehydrogenase assembly factor 2 [Candidatus Thiodiazotropha taylori]MCG7893357.1 succinate dehydrogenase assembly factor 2 [Candidatus Thiodiazotropha taylori]MCG7909088.1 succinate dehydrogenase assembly factor 2 [Candidatus Thiodiazotropha taylori]MCG7916718.1 succinate dehydrogenase assembly factor 2 [Candidatus Thiodiazotropha taylori]MCG7925797.1 succinate dehydrogenase assembly factor 2 [Candidatus Thiodiazotropha taylori]